MVASLFDMSSPPALACPLSLDRAAARLFAPIAPQKPVSYDDLPARGVALPDGIREPWTQTDTWSGSPGELLADIAEKDGQSALSYVLVDGKTAIASDRHLFLRVPLPKRLPPGLYPTIHSDEPPGAGCATRKRLAYPARPKIMSDWRRRQKAFSACPVTQDFLADVAFAYWARDMLRRHAVFEDRPEKELMTSVIESWNPAGCTRSVLVYAKQLFCVLDALMRAGCDGITLHLSADELAPLVVTAAQREVFGLIMPIPLFEPEFHLTLFIAPQT